MTVPRSGQGPGRIVILGGGTAGWMAANLFANAWPGRAQVTVVESPDIGIIGVGEGSTPQLKAFFDTLGIAEIAWMPACNATYKNGIAFHGWSDRPGFESYFHPFPGPLDLHTAPAFFDATRRRRHGQDVWAHPDRFFLSSRLAAARLSPIAPEHFPLGPSYGYHFDAHLVGAFLRDHAVGQGVRHLERRIVEVAVAEGSVTDLVAEGGERIAGDLFVDASGFRSAIHQAALGVPFRSFGETLFNDSAVVMPTPSDPGGRATATRATALGNGWVWDIPLTSRTGNGYVYASRYCAREEAERDLRAHLGVGDAGTARHLSMKVGRVAESWVSNSLAIGLAQGFIEPLEATALHIVQATVEGFIRAWSAGGFSPQNRAAFNARIAARYDGIRDYIVAHYRMNGRSDTPYWRDNAANTALSDSLKAIITCWFTGGELEAEIAAQGIGGYYSALSWHCLFAGYGAFPRTTPHAPTPGAADMTGIDAFLRHVALNFG
ncbi:tryptophan halogenase family protein [Sphingomonas sp. PAMC 26605]|uniref:tryptophan halogenase family protein n=1 Tax=Sphingomonas sp. PAMC 26605 TaxID=1112214 RepID=UPI00030ADB7C|nr:tryptophan halogenase family protein [Sphingomonas sp. PAMC 26605]